MTKTRTIGFATGALAWICVAGPGHAAPSPVPDPTLDMCVNRPTACMYMLIGFYQSMMINREPASCIGPDVALQSLVTHLRRHREDWHKGIEEQLRNALCKR